MGIQKAIPLMLLIALGYCLQGKFQNSAETGAIKTLIINLALPATLFLSILSIDTRLGLMVLPAAALCINLYLLVVGFVVARWVIPAQEAAKARSLILLFPSLAPGLTAYPFIEEFLGNRSLAWASLADVGNKVFVLIGLYVLAMYWQQRVSATTLVLRHQFKAIGLALVGEPANIAVILSLSLVAWQVKTAMLPDVLVDVCQKLAACTTPLILVFVGISLKAKGFEFKRVISVLLARSAAGFCLSAGAIALGNFTDEARLLAVVLPQVGCSLWPFLYATQMNNQSVPGPSAETAAPQTFDLNFALALLTTSIPFSIGVVLTVFSSSEFFASPLHLGWVGAGLWGIFGLLLAIPDRTSQRSRSHKSASSQSPQARPPQTRPLQTPALSFAANATTLAARQGNPKALALVLQQWLQAYAAEYCDVQVQCALQPQILLVLIQHPDAFLDHQSVFRPIETALQQLQLPGVQDVRVYLRVHGKKQPYASHNFQIKVRNSASFVSKNAQPISAGRAVT